MEGEVDRGMKEREKERERKREREREREREEGHKCCSAVHLSAVQCSKSVII